MAIRSLATPMMMYGSCHRENDAGPSAAAATVTSNAKLADVQRMMFCALAHRRGECEAWPHILAVLRTGDGVVTVKLVPGLALPEPVLELVKPSKLDVVRRQLETVASLYFHEASVSCV
jgi:hypothetical protein